MASTFARRASLGGCDAWESHGKPKAIRSVTSKLTRLAALGAESGIPSPAGGIEIF
jgi:hypothetical protein